MVDENKADESCEVIEATRVEKVTGPRWRWFRIWDLRRVHGMEVAPDWTGIRSPGLTSMVTGDSW